MTQKKRVRKWINTLTPKQCKNLLHKSMMLLIIEGLLTFDDDHEVPFWSDNSPYWHCNEYTDYESRNTN